MPMTVTVTLKPLLVDLRQAGLYLSLARPYVASLLLRENIEPVEFSPRLKRWRLSDLDALIERITARPAQSACTAQRQTADLAIAAVERRSAARRRVSERNPNEIRKPRKTA